MFSTFIDFLLMPCQVEMYKDQQLQNIDEIKKDNKINENIENNQGEDGGDLDEDPGLPSYQTLQFKCQDLQQQVKSLQYLRMNGHQLIENLKDSNTSYKETHDINSKWIVEIQEYIDQLEERIDRFEQYSEALEKENEELRYEYRKYKHFFEIQLQIQ